MKTIILTVDYRDNSRKFWFNSYIKNKIIEFDPILTSVHKAIAEACEEEGMTLTYKAKPQGNIYRDKKDGTSKIVGYMYRGKSEIHDRSMDKPQMGYFDVWATIEGEVNDFEFEDVDNH